MLEMFFVENGEKVTLKRMLSKVFVGAPICILFGTAWIMSSIGGFEEIRSGETQFRFRLVGEGFEIFTLLIMVAGFYLVYYGIKLIIQSVRAYSEWKRSDAK